MYHFRQKELYVQRPWGGRGQDKLEEQKGSQRGWKGGRAWGPGCGEMAQNTHSLAGHRWELSISSKSNRSHGGVLSKQKTG